MEKQIRGISWLKKIDMQKAGVRCRSSELSLLNEQHIELKEQYTKAQKCIVKEILTVAGKSSVHFIKYLKHPNYWREPFK